MNFIQAIIEISKRSDLSLCDEEIELNGLHSSICVYKDDLVIGKLRWPYEKNGMKYKAEIDESILKELLTHKPI